MEQRSRSVIGEFGPSQRILFDRNSYQNQQQQVMPQQQQEQNPREIRSLFLGWLQASMDKDYILDIFGEDKKEVVSVKICWPQYRTGYGCAFIKFATRAAAERALQTYNGTLMPDTGRLLRLAWVEETRLHPDQPEYCIFVGNLASDVTNETLREIFGPRYPSFTRARVKHNWHTGMSRGFGYVWFKDETEKSRALLEMNRKYCLGQSMILKERVYLQNTGNSDETDGNSTTGRSLLQAQQNQAQYGNNYGYQTQGHQPYRQYAGLRQNANMYNQRHERYRGDAANPWDPNMYNQRYERYRGDAANPWDPNMYNQRHERYRGDAANPWDPNMYNQRHER